MRAPTFTNVKVVGMHFRGEQIKSLVSSFQPPMSNLRLVREPDNEYDSMAVMVYYNEHHIGYIERGQAAFLAPHMDAGTEYTCTVDEMMEIKNNLHPVCTLTPVPSEATV